MQINVSVQGGVYKYSVDPNPPLHNSFLHHCPLREQITWRNSVPGQPVTVTFHSNVCPFVNADGSALNNCTATLAPGQTLKVNPNFPRARYYYRIKYTVTVPGADPDDPEVIIVDA
jgi:hypothetical protein